MYEDTGYYNHVHMYTASAKEQNARTRTCIFAAYFNELIRVIARKTVTEKTDCRVCDRAGRRARTRSQHCYRSKPVRSSRASSHSHRRIFTASKSHDDVNVAMLINQTQQQQQLQKRSHHIATGNPNRVAEALLRGTRVRENATETAADEHRHGIETRSGFTRQPTESSECSTSVPIRRASTASNHIAFASS